ncbi:MAG: hypothetical protein ACUVQ8_03440 [Nitrososphaeria archaeon]
MEQLYLVVILSVACFVVTCLLTALSTMLLKKARFLVEDFHKKDKRLVPKPAGPAIFVGVALPLLFLFFHTSEMKYGAVLLSVSIIFLIGLIDDLMVLSGKLKMALTVLGSLPLLVFNVYDPHLVFPIFGSTRLILVYPLIVLAAIPVVANAVNMIDVYNGTVSGVTVLLALSQTFPLTLYGHFEDAIFPLLLFSASLAFYLFNRYPSRIFAGDSGSLLLGAFFGASAIVTRTEITSLVAFVPAILNGFYILASLRGIVEHRSIKVRPVYLNEEGLLVSSKERAAPMTLARLIVADGPLSEKKAASRIILLFAYSTLLAILTSLLMKS